jgi:hypothetical protein
MLRIDIPIKVDAAVHGWATRYYSGPSIFSFTLTDEATVMKKNLPWDAPARLTYREPEAEAAEEEPHEKEGYYAQTHDDEDEATP